MLKNPIKIALTSFIHHRNLPVLSIAGLTIGMSAFILIALYIQYELNYNRFNKNYSSIYRVETEHILVNGNEISEETPFPLGPFLVTKFPEVLYATRLMPLEAKSLSSGMDKSFIEEDGIYSDNSIFNIFSFNCIEGDTGTALNKPFTIVLTKSLADKYFPDEEPVGKILRYDNKFDCTVTGVIEDPPSDSDIQFSYLLSFLSRKTIVGWDYSDDWDSHHVYTYILLSENCSSNAINEKISNVIDDFGHTHQRNLFIEPLSKIHLYQEDERGFSKVTLIYLFGTMAFLILLIACVNFINLTNAFSLTRSKEIAIKKVVGSSRTRLVIQFLTETVVLSIISTIIAFILVYLLIPIFNNVIHRELHINLINDYKFIISIFLIALFAGILSGSYPAFLLSSLKTINILKNPLIIIGGKTRPKRILVFIQSVTTIVFMIISFVVYKQMDFMKKKELGFNKDHIIICNVETESYEEIRKNESFKRELLKNPNIRKMAFSYGAPFYNDTYWDFRWEGSAEGETMIFPVNNIDYDFIDTYGMEIIAGRNFMQTFYSDKNKCIINETAAKKLGWADTSNNVTNFQDKYQSAIGKKIIANGQEEYSVIGIVKDFHQRSAYFRIEPFFMNLIGNVPWQYKIFSVKVLSTDLSNTINNIKGKFEEFFPDVVFNFQLLEEDFDSETFELLKGIVKTSGFFTLLSILIGTIGLFGSVSFTILKKTKEIAIRKINGAKVSEILKMLNIDFLKCIIMAFLFAIPIAWYILHKWLENFAYKTELNWWIFALSGLLTLGVAWLTVSWKTWKASTRNPVEALRYE